MIRFRLPSLEYGLSHPHPKGHWFLLATIIVFILTLPVLILVNVATLGYNLVPSLQPRFQSNDTLLDSWWGTRRLPHLLRPRTPPCEPKDLGRGDAFRLSGSLFDYTVMTTWNTTEGPTSKTSGIQEQKRVEYRGQSFDSCYVNRVRYDYSLGDQTQSTTLGVMCPGYDKYPVEISMETTITFAWELSKDFIGQYYGPGLNLSLSTTSPSDYRKVVLAVMEVISTDAVTIMRKQHLSNFPLSMRVVFDVDPDTAEPIPAASTLTYVNGTQPNQYPEEALIYLTTVYNLVAVVIDAVNLDLGSYRTPNAFRNATRLNVVVQPNLAPNNISAADWAEGSQTFYYGNLTSPYQTWAEALRDGHPVRVNNLTGLPGESVMATTYLCPSYQIKPLSSLLASVFVGSATMTLSVWSAWMVFTTFLARQITQPQVICYCDDCELRRANEAEEVRRRATEPSPAQHGIFTRLAARVWGSKPAASPPGSADVERVEVSRLEYNEPPPSGRPTHSLEVKRHSDLDGPNKRE